MNIEIIRNTLYKVAPPHPAPPPSEQWGVGLQAGAGGLGGWGRGGPVISVGAEAGRSPRL